MMTPVAQCHRNQSTQLALSPGRRHPVFPGPTTGHIDKVVSRKSGGKGPMFFPGVDTDQSPGCPAIPHEGFLKLPAKHHPV